MPRIVFSLLLTAFLLTPYVAHAAQYRVVAVADGDTITVLTSDKQRIKVRLYGIDCPERGQAFGRRAQEATERAVAGKDIAIRPMDTDRYGRTVAIVSMPGGGTLNDLLVRDGMAWVYTQYCTRADICGPLKTLEAAARTGKQGLWRDKYPTPPWEWRKQKRKATR